MATQPKPDDTDTTQVLTRLTGVETCLAVVKIDLAVVKSNYATKADIAGLETKMAQMETRLIKWFIGTAITLSAVVGTIAFAIARFIH